MTDNVTMSVVTPKQIPSDERSPVAAERDVLSTREKRRETKSIHLSCASGFAVEVNIRVSL
jgi:hypothetical protein